MKRIFTILLFTLMFSAPAFADGPFAVDAAYDAAIDYFDIADEVFVGTDGTYAARLGTVAVTPASDFSAIDGTSDGRALQIAAKSITASGTGTADTMGLYDTDTTTVLAYWPITSQAMTSGNVYNFGDIAPLTFRDITVTP